MVLDPLNELMVNVNTIQFCIGMFYSVSAIKQVKNLVLTINYI